MRPTDKDCVQTGFIELLGDACLVLDHEMNVTAANAQASRLYLRSPQELAELSLGELCAEDHADSVIGEVASCAGAPRAFTAAQLRGDGSRFDARVTANRCGDEDTAAVLLLVREQLSNCRDDLELRSLILEECLDGMIAHTPAGEVRYANRAMLAQWGYSTLAEMQAAGPWGWIEREEVPKIAARTAQLQLQRDVRFTAHDVRPDGTDLYREVHARLLETNRGPLVVSTVRDVTDRMNAEAMVRHLAYHDNLTGLANRFLLTDELERELAAAQRHGDTTGIAYIDLDDFKPVNDTMGHSVGDQALRIVAERLVAAVRESDLVARMGGDEFVVLLPRLSRPQDLPAIAAKIAEEVSKPMRIGEHEFSISVSVGLAVHEPGETADAFVVRADLAMYSSRQTGIPGWEIAWL